MNKIVTQRRARLRWNIAVACGLVAWGPGAHAARWNLDNQWVVDFDSLLSEGAALRTSKTNCSFVGADNGGCVGSAPAPLQASNPAEFSISMDTLRLNENDGDLNYKQWQVVNAKTQWVGDLAVKGPDGWSALARGDVYFDAATDNTSRVTLDTQARSFAVFNPRLLDLYLTKDTDIDDHAVRLRVGNQVLSWGEDIYIQGGINSINPLYLPNSHSTGAQLKTLFEPSPMATVNAELTNDLSLEAFYEWKWTGYVYDAAGTFFSTQDYVGAGGHGIFYPTSLINSALNPTLPVSPGVPVIPGLQPLPPGYIGDPATYIVGPNPQTGKPYNRQLSFQELANPATNPVGPILGTGTVIARGPDYKPVAGQEGLALHYKMPGSGNDLGFYYYRYSDKLPYLTYQVVNTTNNPNGLALKLDYGKDRDLYGTSYNFQLSDWVIGTELSYRPRDAVAIDRSTVIDPSSPYYCNGYTQTLPVGTQCRGWVDTSSYQAHVAGINIVSPSGPFGWLLRWTGASESILTAEASASFYPSLKQNAGIPYATTYDYTQPTKEETGVVVYGSLTYPTIFGTRASLTPDLAIQQGINGYPATYLPGFIQGAGAATFGLNVDFKTKPSTTLRLDYTGNWGGAASNLNRDRDYMSLSVTTAL